MSKFSKMFALASKATNRAATLTRKVEGEGSVSLKFDGFPPSSAPAGSPNWPRRRAPASWVTAVVGEGVGKATGTLGTTSAADMVREMTSDETEDATPARRPSTRTPRPALNGTPEAAATA